MKVLVVHAHPEPNSFSSALKAAAIEELQKAGHEVQVSDLYSMQFNPVASAVDFRQPDNPDYLVYALEQRNAVQTGTLSDDIRTELEKLLWCDLLILNFPIFWFSFPAILKGWIDRVLVSGVVYGGKRFYDRGGLQGKRALISATLGGQEHMFGTTGIHGPFQDMLKPILQGTLAYTGMTVLTPFIGWHVPYITHAGRHLILDAWRKRLGTVEKDKPLTFPSLDDFTDDLYPITQGNK